MATGGSYRYDIATDLSLYVSWSTSYSQDKVTVKQTAYIRYKGSLQGGASGSMAWVQQEMTDAGTVTSPLGTINVSSVNTSTYTLSAQSYTYQLTQTSANVYSSITIPLMKTTVGGMYLRLNGTEYTSPSGGWVATKYNAEVDGRNYNAPNLTLTVSDVHMESAVFSTTEVNNRVCNSWALCINGSGRSASTNLGTSWTLAGGDIALSPDTQYQAYVTASTYPEMVSGSSNVVSFRTPSQDQPAITLTTVTVASDYFTVRASSEVSCQNWKYYVDGVEHAASSIPGTEQTITVSQLMPNTTHQFSVSAQNTQTTVLGTSETISITTTAKTTYTTSSYSYILNNALSSISIDVQLASKSGGAYQTSFKHDLFLSSVTLQSRQLLSKQTLTNGSNAISISSADISWIRGIMSGNNSVSMSLVLMTYDSNGTTSYGQDIATITFTIPPPEAPLFSSFEYRDTSTAATDVTGTTGNDPVLIKGYSNLVVYASPATPRGDGVTIVSYSAVFGENSGVSDTTVINLGTVKSYGQANITVTATDSNGLTAQVAKSALSLNYSRITLGGLQLSRNLEDENDNHIYLTMQNGAYNSILVNNVEKNDLLTLTYQYRKSDELDNWSQAVDIKSQATRVGTGFSLSNVQLAELPRDYSWVVRVSASDKLTSYFTDGYVLGDVPLMSFRSGKVGVNNKNPNAALDVIGNIEMNGFNVQGFVRALGSGDDLNTILATGIYTADPSGTYTGLNYPTNDKGVLEVIPETGGLVHRFTKVPVDGKVWIRHYTTQTTSFGQWYQLSGSGSGVTRTSELINDGSDGTSTYLESDETAFRSTSIPYGQVDQTSTKTLYTATVPGITELRDGVCMWLKNGVVTSASGFTININNLGAKPVYSNMAAETRDTTLFNVAYTFFFVYDSTRVTGGCWILYRGYDSNTNTIGYQLRSSTSTKPTLDKFYRYRLLFTSADNTSWVPANTSTSTNATAVRTVNQRPINPFGEIVYYGTTAAVEAGDSPAVGYLWQQYDIALGYSFNSTGAALVLTPPSPVYIKAEMQADGSAIIDADNPYVFSLPTTADGKIYIYLGRVSNPASGATTTANIELKIEHPVYYYFNGAIRKWIHMAEYAQKVEWTGVQNRPTVSHAHVELLSGTDYELVIDDI